MSDVAKYLRTLVKNGPSGWIQMSGEDALKAADEIEKLRVALQTARRDALEEAARVAENEPEPEGDPPPELHGRSVKNIAIASVRVTKRSIAAAIRALGEKG